MTPLRLAVAATLLAGTACPEPATAQTVSAPAPRLAYDRFTLSNGLTVLVHTDHSTPSVFVGTWYKTGSRDEPPGKTGFAHLFEHLMFQSTAHRPQEFMDALKQIGAIDANGVTRTDDTAYFETVPTNALDTVLWLESDRMGYLDGGITQALLDEQRRVVLNEKRQGELRPEDQAWRHFLGAFYPADHPYAHPTIGSTADIEGATLDDVKHWFRTHYGAGNAVLVLSGDIDLATAREKVTRYYGGIRRGDPISRPLQWTPPLNQTRRDVLYGAFAQPGLSRSWAIPSDDPHALTLLQLAARAMTGRQDAPLVKALVTDARVATGVSASVAESQLGSVLSISVGVRPGVSPDAAARALDAALRDYAARGPAPERLQAIVAGSDTQLRRGMENIASVGNWLGSGEVSQSDPAFMMRQRDWIAAARPDAVRAVAATWLARPYYELVTMPTPAAAPLPADIDRSRIPEPGPYKTAIAFPPVTRTTLRNGMTLVVAPRPGVGMVDVSLQFPIGTLADAHGTAARAFDLLGAGDASGRGESIERRGAQMGIRMGAQADEWTSGVTWSVASDRLEPSLALVADMIRHPAYPAAAVAQADAAATGRLDAYERNPSAAGSAILKRAIWGKVDPRGTIPSRQDPHSVTRAALVDFHDAHIVPDDATLYIVGDVDPERAKTLAERAFGDWRAAPATAMPALPVAPPAHTGPRLILVDAPGAQQTSITVGALIPPFDKDRAAAETLVAAALADIRAGRLNRNLRQDKGWTYGFGGSIDDAPHGARLFVASGTVQADKTADSLAELAREFADVTAARPLTAAEIDDQRTASIRAAAQQFGRNEAYLNALVTSGTYGLPLDRATTSERRLNAVTLDQAQALAKTLFRPDALTWVVIGDRRTIEPQIRALGLAPIEIQDVYGRPVR